MWCVCVCVCVLYIYIYNIQNHYLSNKLYDIYYGVQMMSVPAVGFVNGLCFASSGAFLVAALGQVSERIINLNLNIVYIFKLLLAGICSASSGALLAAALADHDHQLYKIIKIIRV